MTETNRIYSKRIRHKGIDFNLVGYVAGFSVAGIRDRFQIATALLSEMRWLPGSSRGLLCLSSTVGYGIAG